MQYLNIRVSLSIKIQNNKNRIATKHPKVYLIMEIKMKKSKLNFASNSGGTIATKNQFPDCQCRLLMSFFVDGTNLINSTTNKHEFIRIFHLLSTKSGNLNTNNSKLVNCCYDANGNLTNDGEYSYSYNMENRLIEIKNEKLKMKNFYDGIGRKVKSLEINLTTGETNETKFIYNNWNVIQEITTSQLHSLTSSYFWGSDLSGSLHGAGGIGGLIANSPFSKGGGGGFYFYNYDANGNVINLINSKGETAAHYEYSPFGKTISMSGYYAETNKFRFSTKRFEEVGELYYYGYRYYKPKTGNWLTRDPINESGGENLYGFVNNNPINQFDKLGLAFEFMGMLFGNTDSVEEKKYLGGKLECIPISGFFQHCANNCSVTRFSGPLFSFSAAVITGRDWPWDKKSYHTGSGDSQNIGQPYVANVTGILNAYKFWKSCIKSCSKSTLRKIDKKCCKTKGKELFGKTDKRCCK